MRRLTACPVLLPLAGGVFRAFCRFGGTAAAKVIADMAPVLGAGGGGPSTTRASHGYSNALMIFFARTLLPVSSIR